MPPKTKTRSKTATVKSTSDYDQFVFLDLNRNILWSHVAKLKAAIDESNLLYCQPIVVNEAMEVIDGQHRLLAARELGVEIYYLQVKGLTIDDAITLNITSTTWTNHDYLRFYVDSGNSHYKRLQEFNDQGHSLTNSVGLLYERRAKATHQAMRDFRGGSFKISHLSYAKHYIEKVKKLNQLLPFDVTRDLLIALDKAMNVEEFDIDRFIEQVEENPFDIHKGGDVITYLRDMEDLFNKGKQKRIRLF